MLENQFALKLGSSHC